MLLPKRVDSKGVSVIATSKEATNAKNHRLGIARTKALRRFASSP